MAFHHRNQILFVQSCYGACSNPPPGNPTSSPPSPLLPPPPPPPPPPLAPPPTNDDFASNSNHNMLLIVLLLLCALGTAFVVVGYLTYVKRYHSTSINSRRRRNPPTVDDGDDDDQEDFVDEDHGPVLDHPIWYINTVGLQQSVIDSITVFKYKKDESLIEGTDCSVCLNEFREDETLRLLPKCSHAFHIPCIDTWLRSHKNCPLCRAPIFCDSITAHVSAPEPNLNQLGFREETLVGEDSDYHEGTSEMGIGTEDFGELPFPSEQRTIPEVLGKDSRYFNSKNCEIRVLSDLADRRTRVEEEIQPVRRSISMDASSASRIYLAVASIPQVEEHEGSSSTQLEQAGKPNSVKVPKGVSRNLSISRLVKSSSTRFSLQNGSVSMKRSSSTEKFSSTRRHTRSQDSVLPL